VKLKKTYAGCVTLTRDLFPGGQGEGDLKNIFPVSFPRSRTVNERYIRYYGWIKYKVRHENLLFGLRMLFSFCFGWDGVGTKGV